jgi:hypothetical protein
MERIEKKKLSGDTTGHERHIDELMSSKRENQNDWERDNILTSALHTDGGRRRWAEAASCQGRRRRGSAARDHGATLAKPNAEQRARDRAWPTATRREKIIFYYTRDFPN